MKASRSLDVAVIAILTFMVIITALRAGEQPDEPTHVGNYTIEGTGSGGPSFDIDGRAELHYEAYGSTFNIYVGTTEQLSGFGNDAPFSYNEELSRLNSSSEKVDGLLDAGSYDIIVEKTGEFSEPLHFSFQVRYVSTSFLSAYYLPMMLISTAILGCLMLALHHFKRSMRD